MKISNPSNAYIGYKIQKGDESINIVTNGNSCLSKNFILTAAHIFPRKLTWAIGDKPKNNVNFSIAICLGVHEQLRSTLY